MPNGAPNSAMNHMTVLRDEGTEYPGTSPLLG
jgi:hypothetical protein